MTLRMLRLFRRDEELERLRRRHLPAVYRYAVLVLPCETDALDVTRATFDRARARLDGGAAVSLTRRWLVDTAHALARSSIAPGDDAGTWIDGCECSEVERVLSRALDGGVRPSDRRRLREHLARCEECRRRQRTYVALRRAFRALERRAGSAGAARRDRFTSSASGGSLASEERRLMGIVNRRNAVIGWAAWQVGKRLARQKAKAPCRPSTSSRSAPTSRRRSRLPPRLSWAASSSGSGSAGATPTSRPSRRR